MESKFPTDFAANPQNTSHPSDDRGVPNEILRIAHRLVPPTDQPGVAILLTSVRTGEGKSLMLRHIALACATLLDQRVLICDLHGREKEKPTSSDADYPAISNNSLVGVPPHMQGNDFSHELQTSYSIEPTLQPHIKQLELNMSHGSIYRFLKGQLPSYRQEYRIVMVESPGILSNIKPDTVVLSPLFDQVVVVTQSHKTSAERIQESLALLRNSGTKKFNVLLNRGPHSESEQPISSQLLRNPWLNRLMEIPVLRQIGLWLGQRSGGSMPSRMNQHISELTMDTTLNSSHPSHRIQTQDLDHIQSSVIFHPDAGNERK